MNLLKSLLNHEFLKDKRVVNTLFVMGLGVMLLIGGSSFIGGERSLSPPAVKTDTPIKQEKGEELHSRLSTILSQIKGAGEVSVMINLSAGKEMVAATDTKKGETITEEKDGSGGGRKVTQTETEQKVVLTSSQTAPVVVKELEPVVQGAIVVAEGADNEEVREALKEATKTVLGVPAFKVQVFPKNKN